MRRGDPPHDLTDTAPLPEWMPQRSPWHHEVPDAGQAQLLAAGSASMPGLIAILADALADDETEPGWVPSHAATLLGMRGDAQAVPVLLRLLAHAEVGGRPKAVSPQRSA